MIIPDPDPVQALADAWASMDGKSDEFRAANGEDESGHRDGYKYDAQSMIARLKTRGWVLVRLATETQNPPPPK